MAQLKDTKINGTLEVTDMINVEGDNIEDFIKQVATNNTNVWAYHRFKSGLTMCWIRSYTTINISIVDGSTYYGDSFTVKFPFTFSSTPMIQVHGQPNKGIAWLTGDSATNASTAYIRPVSTTSITDVTMYFNLLVIGYINE